VFSSERDRDRDRDRDRGDRSNRGDREDRSNRGDRSDRIEYMRVQRDRAAMGSRVRAAWDASAYELLEGSLNARVEEEEQKRQRDLRRYAALQDYAAMQKLARK
jgi:hypothetical protein